MNLTERGQTVVAVCSLLFLVFAVVLLLWVAS